MRPQAHLFAAAAIQYDGENLPMVDATQLPQEMAPEFERLVRRVAFRYGVPVSVEPELALQLASQQTRALQPEAFVEVARLFKRLADGE